MPDEDRFGPGAPDDLELVRRAYEAWNRDDLETFLDFLAPDFEFTTIGYFPGFEPVYRGPEGMADFWQAFKEPWETISIRVDELVQGSGGVVAARLLFEGKGKGSGVEVTLPLAHVIELRDGRTTRLRASLDWDEARRAAGVEE